MPDHRVHDVAIWVFTIAETRITKETATTIELQGRVRIAVFTCSSKLARGYTYAALIGDEVAFWRSETSTDPDKQVLDAIRPGLATLRGLGAMLILISSPHGRHGALYESFRDHWGRDDSDTLVVKAPSWVLNPGFDVAEKEAAYARDPIVAAAELGGEFRADVSRLVTEELVDNATVEANELPPRGFQHYGFIDPSAGQSDSFALAICHVEGDGRVVLDCIRETPAPFQSDAVVKEYAAILQSYGCTEVTSDKWGGVWPIDAFAHEGITVQHCDLPKSELYKELLPLLTAGRVQLLASERLRTQLLSLERRTHRGVRDSVDHPPGGRDDVANAVAGACVVANLLGGGVFDIHVVTVKPRGTAPSEDTPGVSYSDEIRARERRDLEQELFSGAVGEWRHGVYPR